jgi:hypothetical protein
MRKHSIAALAVAVAALSTLVGIATAEVAQVGNLKITAEAKFVPKKLPRNKMAPISLTIGGKIQTLDGTHPPALRELIIETDKNGAVNAKGLPVCTIGKIVATTTAVARKKCPTAIVGEGKTDVEVEFAETPPFPVHSALLAFNGGVKGGVTTLLVHAYLSNPVSAAVITTVKITKIHNGRYGLESVATVPVIAGGAGSVTSFSLKIDRKFTYKGKRQSYLTAKCPDGHLQGRATGVFSDGSRLKTSVVRACTPKG